MYNIWVRITNVWYMYISMQHPKLLLKSFYDRFHQRHYGFSLFKYSIGYFYLPIGSCLKKRNTIWFYQWKTFEQVFTAFTKHLLVWTKLLLVPGYQTITNVKPCVKSYIHVHTGFSIYFTLIYIFLSHSVC
jgi:hypothetical protein